MHWAYAKSKSNSAMRTNTYTKYFFFRRCVCAKSKTNTVRVRVTDFFFLVFCNCYNRTWRFSVIGSIATVKLYKHFPKGTCHFFSSSVPSLRQTAVSPKRAIVPKHNGCENLVTNWYWLMNMLTHAVRF